MINVPLFKRQALRLVKGSKRYADLSDRHWVICPGEQTMSAPAIYLDNALDRVTQVQAETTFAQEMERIQGGMRSHRPTIAYQLHDVQIRQGHVYKDALWLSFTKRKPSIFQWGEVEAIEQAALACTDFAYHYFGHQLLDDLPLALAAEQIAPAIVLETTANRQITEYKSLFEIAPRLVRQANCQHLTIIDDVGQNQFKRDRYRAMRAQLTHFKSPNPPWGVLLLRGKSGTQRALANQDQVIAWLQSQGFVCLVPEELSAAELVRQTLGAKIIMGVEGSQLAHGIFSLAPGGVMCALQPPNRFTNVFKDYLDCISQDMRYAFVVGQPRQDGFEIAVDDLARILEQLQQTATQAR